MAPAAAAISPPAIFPAALRRREIPKNGGAATIPAASRRISLLTLTSTALTILPRPVNAAESWFVVPEQTAAEAEAAVAAHAAALVNLRPLIEFRAWRELQTDLREASPLLKQDLYTIIQSRPREVRPELRKLFSELFNGVTRLDYAARSKDAVAADNLYSGIVSTLETILGKI